MKISSTENIELHDKLFKDWYNYDKWSPFLKEFQQQYKDKCKGLPAGLLGLFSATHMQSSQYSPTIWESYNEIKNQINLRNMESL